MSDEKEKNPKLEIKKLVKMNKPISIVVKTAKHIKEGSGNYGPWYLWKGEVTDMRVTKPDSTDEIPDYTGDVIFFAPTEKFQEQLMEITKGEEKGVKISINKEAFELDDGKIVGKWVLTKLEGGEISPTALKPTEQKLLGDVKEAIAGGYELTEDEFIQLSKEEQYKEGNISEDRAKELYKLAR